MLGSLSATVWRKKKKKDDNSHITVTCFPCFLSKAAGEKKCKCWWTKERLLLLLLLVSPLCLINGISDFFFLIFTYQISAPNTTEWAWTLSCKTVCGKELWSVSVLFLWSSWVPRMGRSCYKGGYLLRTVDKPQSDFQLSRLTLPLCVQCGHSLGCTSISDLANKLLLDVGWLQVMKHQSRLSIFYKNLVAERLSEKLRFIKL